jgi:hypothetical protein
MVLSQEETLKVITAVLFLCCFCTAQEATVNLNQTQNNEHHPANKSGKPKKNKSKQPKQQQRQQQQQGQAQAQQANSSATNSMVSNSQEVRQAPFAYSPEALPSAPCRIAASAGLSSPMGGISLGGSKMDKDCDRRETARAFALIGQYGAALQVLCSTTAAKVVDNCRDLSLPNPVEPVAQPEATPVPDSPVIPDTLRVHVMVEELPVIEPPTNLQATPVVIQEKHVPAKKAVKKSVKQVVKKTSCN